MMSVVNEMGNRVLRGLMERGCDGEDLSMIGRIKSGVQEK